MNDDSELSCSARFQLEILEKTMDYKGYGNENRILGENEDQVYTGCEIMNMSEHMMA
jgi:hypothetical protein